MKTTLVRALSTCACGRQRASALRFLQGLSADELQYIADFFGAHILEAAGGCAVAPRAGEEIAAFERCRHPRPESNDALEDHQHKMILLMEYLGRCGAARTEPALRATNRAG